MEFPDLGAHCAEESCQRLDFLPIRCNACSKLFCSSHFPYKNHHCSKELIGSVQVPQCPLCGAIIPVKSNQMPDIEVSRHIDTNCSSKPALKLKGKIYSNSCSMPSCKRKELVPIECNKCHFNYCIRHRNEMDHKCAGPQHTRRQYSQEGASAIFKAVFSKCSSYLDPREQQEIEDRKFAERLNRQINHQPAPNSSYPTNDSSSNEGCILT